MVVVLVAPIGLAVLVAVVAAVFVRRSWLRITAAGVEVRNYPKGPVVIALDRVARFEATPRTGNFASLRPHTAVLVLVDGARVPVRTLTAPDAGYGVDALNARLESLRQ